MTILDARTDEQATLTDVVWTNPDADLWVATSNGEYAGMIEFTEGHFVVRDATGVEIATTSSIPSAKYALAPRAA